MSAHITTDETTTLYVNESNHNWVVDIGGSITVANGHGIVNHLGFQDSVIAISGDVVADGMYKSGILSEGTDAILQVDTMGSIHAYNGMSVYGAGTRAENLGAITASNIGMYGKGTHIELKNAGSIDGNVGLYVEDSTFQLGNNGHISGSFGVVVENSAGNLVLGVDSVIDVQDTGIFFDNPVNRINEMTNAGEIKSADVAISGSLGREVIINTGIIIGQIVLGGGDDAFDNRYGKIDHAIDGGAGNDTYVLGSSADKIIDASGTDTIMAEFNVDLRNYLSIETVRLQGYSDTNIIGNYQENYLYGNYGDNILDGSNNGIVDFLAGGGGNDTYVLQNGSDSIKEEAGSAGGVDTITTIVDRSLADYSNVENLNLVTHPNWNLPIHINGTGNAFMNVITGSNGNNILDGGLESGDVIDTLKGGAGNDTYVLGTGYDKVIDSAGNDTITSEISRSLASYPAIENLTLVGNGNVAGTGNALVNIITGNGGSNILDGGIDTVTDTLNGGAGNDVYILGSGTDKVIDTDGQHDTITSMISRNLTDYATIEDLVLKGTASVNATGNALANVISGNSGDNILNGGADNVVDTLKGDLGNDTYVLGSGADIVSDGGGIDTITSTISRSLASYSTIENLTLLGSGNINATGNGLANVLTGNAGTNTLDGGAGNDTYVLGSGSDKVIDSAGTDTIISTISRSLASYATIENLTLSGSGNINATGNALANVLTGNAGTNTLNGGAGNDTYVLGSGADTVVDSEGSDTITSLISRNLSTFATIENLKLLGASNISGTGNALANTLTGNSGVNSLSGAAGNDVLIGGVGADKLDGGANTDTASYAGASAGVVANLTTAAANTGEAKGDVYVSIENLTGSSHNDTLTGNTGNNVLAGGTGADKLNGGAGADTFLFKALGDTTVATAGRDTIFDFSHTQGDKIGLSGIDANTALTGDQAFIFKGTAAFSGANGELRFEKQASDTYVYGDTNGDKVADFVIHFDDAIAFQSGDFVL
ncbi:calcium-binding protein (plasmid) [Rhizobium sp. RCAM05350]|nr:calcium-binding protein [Rhizobium sp. RCAM05350]